MRATVKSSFGRLLRIAGALCLALTTLVPATTPAIGAADERSLYLYYTHTKETTRVVFKRDGRYVESGLRQLNQFLRDWRRDEPAKMDPGLFDLLWQVYREVGATQPIHIVSAYRSPATNAMLRARSSGVAENSQHMAGKAMDFFIPGVPLSKLRATAMKYQVGGVGYYPTSGSPFVHLDTGSVRAWPRMTRTQLAQVFPDGKTLHLPTDGRPLSDSGRQYAMAQWQQCHQVPCRGTTPDAEPAIVEALIGGNPGVQVASATDLPVVPMDRPSFITAATVPAATLVAPVPMQKSRQLQIATADLGQRPATALDAISALQPSAAPGLLHSPALTAYAALPDAGYPEAERALRMLIARETTAALPSQPQPAPQPGLPAEPRVQVASLGGGRPLDAIGQLLTAAFGMVTGAPAATAFVSAPAPATIEPQRRYSLETRDRVLFAPDLEHVEQTMVSAAPVAGREFAVLTLQDEADFNPATEMGANATPLGFTFDRVIGLDPSRFTPYSPR